MFETDDPLERAKQQKNSITTGIKADRLVPNTMAKGWRSGEPDKQAHCASEASMKVHDRVLKSVDDLRVEN